MDGGQKIVLGIHTAVASKEELTMSVTTEINDVQCNEKRYTALTYHHTYAR